MDAGEADGRVAVAEEAGGFFGSFGKDDGDVGVGGDGGPEGGIDGAIGVGWLGVVVFPGGGGVRDAHPYGGMGDLEAIVDVLGEALGEV